MRFLTAKRVTSLALGFGILCFNNCGGWWEPSPTRTMLAAPPAAPLAAPEDMATRRAIQFLEERVRRDTEDFSAYNRLAALYLQRARETDNQEYLDLAARAARASLTVMPAERNVGGLYALTQYEHATHNFVAARDHAKQLTELDPGKSDSYLMLGDALIELGNYEEATITFRQVQRMNNGSGAQTEMRLARLATLHGDHTRASHHFTNALALALNMPVPSRDAVAWCRWQLGETAFATGDYETAERHYRDALTTYTEYRNARASMARLRAARGDLAGAIEGYEGVVRHLPDPVFVAALGDVYKLAGREREAAAQYALVEQIARLNEVNGALYNRQLALFYADHDMNAEEAYRSAVREYEVRRDIYGADAVAWTALKAGKINEAQTAMRDALRLGTRDARLFYHAGMIARAAGEVSAARDYLQRSLALNPQFDPLQALIATRALEALS